MTEDYEKLSKEAKQKIDWNGIEESIWYNRKTDSKGLAVRVVSILPRYFPNMVVSKNSSLFGAYLSVPKKGNARISFLGMPISDVENVLNSEIFNGVYIGSLEYANKISFEQKDLDSGARVEIKKEFQRLLSFHQKPHVQVIVWPVEKEGNKKLLTTVIDDIRNHTVGWG